MPDWAFRESKMSEKSDMGVSKRGCGVGIQSWLTLNILSTLEKREMTPFTADTKVFILIFAWAWHGSCVFASGGVVHGIIHLVHLFSTCWQSKRVIVCLGHGRAILHLKAAQHFVAAWGRDVYNKIRVKLTIQKVIGMFQLIILPRWTQLTELFWAWSLI